MFSERLKQVVARLRLKRAAQAVVLVVAMVTMLGAGDSGARFDKLGHQMMCSCGCGQILLECNHVSCPASPVQIDELHTQLAQGGSDDAILSWFAGKYGATILASPMRGGFDNVAWITPIAVFLFATLGTAVLVRVWKARTDRLHPVAKKTAYGAAKAAGMDAKSYDELQERIRRETQY